MNWEEIAAAPGRPAPSPVTTILEKALPVVNDLQGTVTDKAHLIIRTDSGWELPLVASPAAVAPLLGKSDHGVRNDCIAGRIPTLPRASGNGAHHRIPVARLLDELGVPYRIEPVGRAREPKDSIAGTSDGRLAIDSLRLSS
jgi:hypothetical protein